MHYNSDTKTLTISCEIDKELKDIPEETQIIIFYNKYPNYLNFNQIVDNLPKNLIHITFEGNLKQKVDNLPQSLTHLIFAIWFNQKVDNLPKHFLDFPKHFLDFPKNLIHLTFDHLFNQKVDNLPKNLTHLTFNCHFNQKVDNLPKNLTHLTFGWEFNQKVYNLPKNLTHLKYFGKLEHGFQNEIILPQKLKELSLTSNNNFINNIPEHIEKIYIYFWGNKIRKVENLPLTIKEIVIENEKFKEYIKIPFGCILTIQKIE